LSSHSLDRLGTGFVAKPFLDGSDIMPVLHPLGYVNTQNCPRRLDLQGDISLDAVPVSVMQALWGRIRSLREAANQQSAAFILLRGTIDFNEKPCHERKKSDRRQPAAPVGAAVRSYDFCRISKAAQHSCLATDRQSAEEETGKWTNPSREARNKVRHKCLRLGYYAASGAPQPAS